MVYLIDGNAYLNVAANVIKRILFSDKSIGNEYYMKDIFNEGRYMLKETSRIKFRDFSLNYLTSLISPINQEVNEVHIVFDSKSWRKDHVNQFFSDSSPEETTFKYKSSRKSDDMMYLFFEYFQDNIQKHLEKTSGINFHRIDGMEGDDIIAVLTEKFSDKDMAIYTVDKDLIQLVKNSDNYTFLVMPKMMTKYKKIIYTEKQVNSSKVNDFFNLDQTDVSSSINGIISKFEKKGYKKISSNPTEELLAKIFGGDKSDDIPRIHKMTPSKVKKITEYLTQKYPADLVSRIDNCLSEESILDDCVSKMIEINKLKDQAIIDSLKENLRLNIRIIRLSSNMIPEKIKSQEYQNLCENVQYKRFNFTKLVETKNNSVLI